MISHSDLKLIKIFPFFSLARFTTCIAFSCMVKIVAAHWPSSQDTKCCFNHFIPLNIQVNTVIHLKLPQTTCFWFCSKLIWYKNVFLLLRILHLNFSLESNSTNVCLTSQGTTSDQLLYGSKTICPCQPYICTMILRLNFWNKKFLQ